MQDRPSRARDIVRRLSALREESSNSKSQPPLLGDDAPGCCGCLLRLLPRPRRRRPNRPHNSNDVKVELQDAPTAKRKSAVGLDDFVVEAVLGSGMFATVALVSDKDSGEQFALKSLNKRQVVARYQVKAAKAGSGVAVAPPLKPANYNPAPPPRDALSKGWQRNGKAPGADGAQKQPRPAGGLAPPFLSAPELSAAAMAAKLAAAKVIK